MPDEPVPKKAIRLPDRSTLSSQVAVRRILPLKFSSPGRSGSFGFESEPVPSTTKRAVIVSP